MSYAQVQPMLPLSSLDEFVGLQPQTRVHTTSSVQRIPTAQAIARASVRALPLHERKAPTFVTQRTRAGRIAWPIFLCGFIAGIFGGLAFVKSPVGKKPVVQHVVKKANAMIGSFVR